jgi:hypothetical protein
MKKMAFFVEGATELLFIGQLIHEIAGQKNLFVDCQRIKGGASVPKQYVPINYISRQITLANANASTCDYYVMIFNCQGEGQVLSRIDEEHLGLQQSGYEKIIGVRDLYPEFKHADIPRITSVINTKLVGYTTTPAVDFIFSTMEIESLFLAETTHYAKIDQTITTSLIHSKLGFNPEKDDMEQRNNPAKDLNDCYQLAGKVYDKNTVNDTISVLDFADLYCTQSEKFSSLSRLISHIENFLT